MRLIISEKEAAARTKAEILGEGVYTPEEIDGITYFRFDDTVIVAARGHLISSRLRFPRPLKIDALPIFEMVWSVGKHEKPRLKVIEDFLKKATEVIVATDYDREGEAIGYNILNYLEHESDPSSILRAYYSTLTEEDIKRAFAEVRPMSEKLLVQGLARDYADLIMGMNLTKMLTLLVRETNPKVTQAISMGRVQSPVLAHVKDYTGVEIREEAELSETREDSWKHYIQVDGKWWRVFIWDEEELTEFEVLEVKERTTEVEQAERLFNTNDVMIAIPIDPKALMATLEALYLDAYASYPRTKSRHVHPRILKGLERKIRIHYPDLVPTQFKYEHAPTGLAEVEKAGAIVLTEAGIEALATGKMTGHKELVAKVIMNQIIKSFAPPLVKRTLNMRVRLDEDERWIEWSTEFENLEHAIDFQVDKPRPPIDVGEYPITSLHRRIVDRSSLTPIFERSIRILSDTDILSWMTEEGIGTEATRSSFPSVLRSRNYTMESNLPTMLGDGVSEVIEDIGLSVEMTREMEERLEAMERLEEMDEFKEWVNDQTTDLLRELRTRGAPAFECPEKHTLTLISTKVGLMCRCNVCDKWVRI